VATWAVKEGEQIKKKEKSLVGTLPRVLVAITFKTV
jgi:hypothetical protein